VRALRFFRVMPLHSTYMLWSLVALGVFGVAELIVDHSLGTEVAMPVLLLQMFAVCSGFDVPARRGHFDLLFTGGSSRLEIAAAHWFVSAVPGIAVWLVVGLAETIVRGGVGGAVFSSGSIAAMALISTLGWAVSVPLPRLSGGVIWLVVLFVALTTSSNWRIALLTVGHGGLSQEAMGVMFVVCPVLMAGTTIEKTQLVAVMPGLAVGFLAAMAAAYWIARSNIPLEAGQ
jgi:hypothetical protein